MLRSFSYSLLITCFLLATSCKTNYIPTSFDTRNISVSNEEVELDSQLVKIYLPYKNELDKDMNRVISTSENQMTKARPESNLTNFLNDLLLEEANISAKDNNPGINIDISYFNYGGIRAPLPKGKITVGNIFELMPFENEMVFLQLNGNQVQEFLDQIAANGGESVGGMRYTVSNEKAKNIQIKGKDLNNESKYWLVTNDYVADGGDGFKVLTQRSEIIKTEKKIRDIIISYLEKKHKNHEIITAGIDRRISNE